MSFFASKRTPKEQIESGRLTFLLALKLSRVAYQVSKRKLQQFYIPTLVLIAIVLAVSKFLHSEGREFADYAGISMMLFAFYSWAAVQFYWSGIAIEFFGHVHAMFGPKTRDTALECSLEGKPFDLVQTSKMLGEYADSRYAKSVGNTPKA